MWVKICGITEEEDALMCVALGADALGFVFAPSPRQVTPGRVRDITKRLPPEVMTVGVFRDQSPGQVVDAILEGGLMAAQLHGHETPADAAAVRPKVQALIVGMPAGDAAVERFDDYHADALLLDGAAPGSGEVFDWALAGGIPSNRRVILSGGLRPSNVAAGIEAVGPWGVDVSTGVEARPGVKDPRKVRSFIRAARAAGDESGAPAPEGESPFDWFEAGGL